MAEQWLSIVEYARTYKISDMTVRRRIKTGRLEAVLQDGKYYIPIKPTTIPKVTASNPSVTPRDDLGDADFQVPLAKGAITSKPEIQVIKGHPTAPIVYPEPSLPPLVNSHKVFAAQGPAIATSPASKEVMYSPSPVSLNQEGAEKVIPSSLRQSLIQYETSLIDSKALIAFCESVLRKLHDSERKTVEKFKSKLEALEATIVAKDQEIKNLRQQLEDLQLLVKILERRKANG